MSYESMARAYVEELVREAFGLDEVAVDTDRDLPFPYGTALFYASVIDSGRLLRVWSRAVMDIPVTKPVLREINSANVDLMYARVWAGGSCVIVEGCLPVETLRVQDVGTLCTEVGTTADQLGSMLAAVHGGSVVFPDGCGAHLRTED